MPTLLQLFNIYKNPTLDWQEVFLKFISEKHEQMQKANGWSLQNLIEMLELAHELYDKLRTKDQ